jgi:hypothetical protein
VNGLVSFGGDPNIVASRSEIERISGALEVVQRRLVDELQPLAQLNGFIQHIQFDIELPETLVRLGLQRHGCYVAAESYFSADARIAHQLNGLAQTIQENPWLAKAIPKEGWVALAGVTAAGVFTNTPVTSQVVRAAVSQLPIEHLPAATSVLPNPQIALEERQPKLMSAPTNLQQMATRLHNKSGNIRIEGYATAEGRVLVVYLPGTGNWNPVGKGSPFDLESDLELLADKQNSNSVRAANAALSAFGARADDRLIFVGYSQGGMVAAELAETRSNVSGLITLGAPIARSEFQSNLPVLAIEHTNDVVPACSGKTNPLTDNWVTASRHLDLEPGQSIGEAHKISNYVATAGLADASSDSGLARVRRQLLTQLEGSVLLETKEYAATKESLVP